MTTISIDHGKWNIMFVIKIIVALISSQNMSNRKHSKFGGKTENFAEIKANTMHFLLIINNILIITIIISKTII